MGNRGLGIALAGAGAGMADIFQQLALLRLKKQMEEQDPMRQAQIENIRSEIEARKRKGLGGDGNGAELKANQILTRAQAIYNSRLREINALPEEDRLKAQEALEQWFDSIIQSVEGGERSLSVPPSFRYGEVERERSPISPLRLLGGGPTYTEKEFQVREPSLLPIKETPPIKPIWSEVARKIKKLPFGGKQTMKLSGEDKAAFDWANENPNDPRAQRILRRLGR